MNTIPSAPTRVRRATLGLLASAALVAASLGAIAPAVADTYPLGDVAAGPGGSKCEYLLSDLTVGRAVTASQPLAGATFVVSASSVDGTGGQPRFLTAAFDVDSAENVAWRDARAAVGAYATAYSGPDLFTDPGYLAVTASMTAAFAVAKAANEAATVPGPVTVTTDASGIAIIPTMVFATECTPGSVIVTEVTVTETIASHGYELSPTPLVARYITRTAAWTAVNGFDVDRELFFLLGGQVAGTPTAPLPVTGTFPVVSG